MTVLPPSLYSNWWTAPTVLFAESTVLCVPRIFFSSLWMMRVDQLTTTNCDEPVTMNHCHNRTWADTIHFQIDLLFCYQVFFCMCRCERERGGGIKSTCMQLHLTVSLYVEPIGCLDISPLVLFLWDRFFHGHKSIFYYPTSPRDLPISASHRACFLCVY